MAEKATVFPCTGFALGMPSGSSKFLRWQHPPKSWVSFFKMGQSDLVLSEVFDAKQLADLVVARVHLKKPASVADVIKAADSLGLKLDPSDPCCALKNSLELVRALDKKGFDGVLTHKASDASVHNDQNPMVIVFDAGNVELLDGVHRKIQITRFERRIPVPGEGWTDHHHSVGLNMLSAPFIKGDLGADALAGLLEDAKKASHDGKFDLNALSKNGDEILVLKGALNPLPNLKLLVSQGGDIRSRTSNLVTALHMAKDPSVIDWLVAQGLDPNAVDINGKTPLHRRGSHDFPGASSRLIHWGAEVNARDLEGRTPLHFLAGTTASADQIRATAAALFGANADLNAKNNEGRTPLHACAGAPNRTLMLELIKAGANMDCEDNRGLRPIHLAVKGEHTTMHTLIALGASVWGVCATKAPLDNEICDSPFKAALRILSPDGVDVLAESLKRFPQPSTKDLEWAKIWITKKGLAAQGALLSAHLAKNAIDRALENPGMHKKLEEKSNSKGP